MIDLRAVRPVSMLDLEHRWSTLVLEADQIPPGATCSACGEAMERGQTVEMLRWTFCDDDDGQPMLDAHGDAGRVTWALHLDCATKETWTRVVEEHAPDACTDVFGAWHWPVAVTLGVEVGAPRLVPVWRGLPGSAGETLEVAECDACGVPVRPGKAERRVRWSELDDEGEPTVEGIAVVHSRGCVAAVLAELPDDVMVSWATDDARVDIREWSQVELVARQRAWMFLEPWSSKRPYNHPVPLRWQMQFANVLGKVLWAEQWQHVDWLGRAHGGPLRLHLTEAQIEHMFTPGLRSTPMVGGVIMWDDHPDLADDDR